MNRGWYIISIRNFFRIHCVPIIKCILIRSVKLLLYQWYKVYTRNLQSDFPVFFFKLTVYIGKQSAKQHWVIILLIIMVLNYLLSPKSVAELNLGVSEIKYINNIWWHSRYTERVTQCHVAPRPFQENDTSKLIVLGKHVLL